LPKTPQNGQNSSDSPQKVQEYFSEFLRIAHREWLKKFLKKALPQKERERRIKAKFEFSFEKLTPILTNEEVRKMFYHDFANTIRNSYYASELPENLSKIKKGENPFPKTAKKNPEKVAKKGVKFNFHVA